MRSPRKLPHQPSMPAILVRDRVGPRCTEPGDRSDCGGRRPEPAPRRADARDTPRQQIAIGMLNDVWCGHYLKGIHWDGSGMCLFAKRLERGKFVWPPLAAGTLTLTPAQTALLLEAMDWRRTVEPPAPPRPMLV
jgi:hypothetical protein